MTLIRAVIFAGLLVSGPALAGGFGVGFGFQGSGFSASFGFHGGGHGPRFGPGFRPGFGPGFGFPGIGLPGEGHFIGVNGFLGLRPGRGLRRPYAPYAYGPGYPAYVPSGYNRNGWRKWWTYTDFSQINYPGVYPVKVAPGPQPSEAGY